MAPITKHCTQCQKPYYLIDQEQSFYKHHDILEPDHCPECRQKERLAQRNERKLHNRNCDKCSKQMISTYPADSPYTIYCQDCFWQWLG